MYKCTCMSKIFWIEAKPVYGAGSDHFVLVIFNYTHGVFQLKLCSKEMVLVNHAPEA